MSAAAEVGGGAPRAVSDLPLVGRGAELQQLRRGLGQAKAGSGSAWSVIGPGGIGKTRLLRSLEAEAQDQGLRVRWGYCLKEALSPFLPFEQIFRSAEAAAPEASGAPSDLAGATILFEEERPRKVLARASELSSSHPLLLIGRDRPAALRQKFPDLPPAAEVLWLTRTEGPDCISPGSIDTLGERIDTFLQEHPGGVVALTGLEYMISQSGFLPVLRLVQMLRDVAEASQGTMLLAIHAATLEDRERSLLEAEGEVVKEAAAATAAESPPTAEPPALRLLRYLETLREESKVRPQLLLLDDLQWSDPQSRTAFQFLARNAKDLPVMIVGALRGEDSDGTEAPGDDPLSEVLDHMDQEGILRQIRLGGLQASDAGQLVQGMLGVPLALGPTDRAFLDVLERTGGNPYFLLESLQQLVEQGFLRSQGDRAVLSLPTAEGSGEGGTVRIPIPPTIRRLVTRRLEGLAAEDRRFLEVASVVGSEFDLPPLVAVLGRASADVEDTARRMVRRLRLLQPGARDGAYEFAHPLVWEVLRSSIDPSVERQVALSVGRWWEKERPGDVESLARFFHTSRGREEGLLWIGKALDMAVAARASGVATRYLSWRRDLLTDSPSDLELRAIVEVPTAVRLNRDGAGAAARKLAEEVSRLHLQPPWSWEAKLAHVQVNFDVGVEQSSSELDALEKELSSGRAPVPPDLLARVWHTRAAISMQQGKWEDAFTSSARVRTLPASQVEADHRVESLLAEAFCLKEVGRMPESLQRLDEAKEALGSTHLPETSIRFYNVQGAILFHVGDLPGALKAIEEAIRRAHETGNVVAEILYRANTANVAWVMGDLERSLQMCDEGVALARKFSFDRGLHNIRRVRCAVVGELGRFEEAERDYLDTLAWLEKAGQALYVAETRSGLASVHGKSGDAKRAVQEYDAVEEFYITMGELSHAELCVERARYRARCGDLPGARADLAIVEKVAGPSQSKILRSRFYLSRAEVEACGGELEKARASMKQGLDLLKELGVIGYRGVRVADLERRLADTSSAEFARIA